MTLRVAQLSDTHFLEPGLEPEGGHAYDTSQAFDAVLEHLERHPAPDLVVVTGDIADHGRAGQYEIAAAALARLPAPVHLCPGNHDFDEPLRAGFGPVGLEVPRVTHHGPWAFVYVDSNAGRMEVAADGGRVDTPGDHRLHGHGSLGEHEADWFGDTLASLDAEHVFVWVHHPPDADVPLSWDAAYVAEWRAIAGDAGEGLGAVRGFGAGHTHVPSTYHFAGRPVFVSPALKNNFDLAAGTWLPPGYRSYEFADDGTVTSDVHLIDDDRWPRRPFGRALRSLFMGEITLEQLAEIAARRRSG